MNETPSSSPEAEQSELPGTVAGCHELIGDLLKAQLELQARLSELEERLKLNSRNSSKPPSSDGASGTGGRTKPRSSRKRGGQPGHKGSYRAAVEQSQLDRIVDCAAPTVCDCGGTMLAHGRALSHQVFELPMIRPIITEYRRQGSRCACCGKHRQAALPSGVPAGQLGPRALALAGTLAGQFHLTQGKIQKMFEQVFGLRFSLGAISQAHGKVADVLAPVTATLHQALQQAPVKHVDETSHQSHGHLMWLWALVSDWGASFQIKPSRGKGAAQELLGASPTGVIVSDRYAGYLWVDTAQRQLCWSHLIRDFNRIGGRAGLPGCLGRSLHAMALLLFRYRKRNAPVQDYLPLQARLQRVLKRAVAQQDCSKTANTCDNLLRLWPAMWHFLANPAVSPTNNHAERAIRGVVLRRKISYLTRSGRGLRFVERVFAVAYSCRQQGKSLFHFLHNTFNASLNRLPYPSLVPGAE